MACAQLKQAFPEVIARIRRGRRECCTLYLNLFSANFNLFSIICLKTWYINKLYYIIRQRHTREFNIESNVPHKWIKLRKSFWIIDALRLRTLGALVMRIYVYMQCLFTVCNSIRTVYAQQYIQLALIGFGPAGFCHIQRNSSIKF